MKTETKTILILSTLAALSVFSTASFAQDFTNYSSAYGNANATVATVSPADGSISTPDWGYQNGPRQHRVRVGR